MVEFAQIPSSSTSPARRVGGGGGAGGNRHAIGEGAATMFREGDFFLSYQNSIILFSTVISFFLFFQYFFNC